MPHAVNTLYDDMFAFARKDISLEERRAAFDRFGDCGGARVDADQAFVRGVPGRWLLPENPKGVVLHLHGGGFSLGSSQSHKNLTSRIADISGCAVFSADYRRSPEHVFPAALDDAVEAFLGLNESQFATNTPAAVVGDSAGACLALAMVHRLKRQGLALPSCVGTMSALTDATLSAPSIGLRSEKERLLTQDGLARSILTYLGDHDPSYPEVSPLFGDLSGFPPLLMQVGTEEILHDDTIRFAHKALDQDVNVQLEIYPGMPHVFQLMAGLIETADMALKYMSNFVREMQLR
jgi:epsilon-lactone hydrolase